MIEGQEVWFLQKPNNYRKSISDCITKCIYKGVYQNDKNRFCQVQLIINGKPVITMVANSFFVFETLEDLKKHIIHNKKHELSKLTKQVNDINEEIRYLQSLKDIKQDREDKLVNLLNP